MSDFLKTGLSVAGAIIGLAIIAVIVSRKSQAPQAITAISSGLARIVEAAVSPQNTATTNGAPGLNSFGSSPLQSANASLYSIVSGLGG